MTKDFARPLSGNTLKFIAAIAMAFDHAGMFLFPKLRIFRIIGRLAFPLFAFFIAEGCRYTRNRRRYFLVIFSMAVVYQIVYLVAMRELYLSVFVSFSIAILLIYLYDLCQKALLSQTSKKKKALTTAAFLAGLTAAVAFCLSVTMDYGVFGCLTPLFAYLLPPPTEETSRKKWYHPVRVLTTAIPLVALAFTSPMSVQPYSLFTLPLLLLYSGKRGSYNLKYFFYAFYPLHLAVIYAIYYFL